MSRGNFNNFLASLGAFESGIDVNQTPSIDYLKFLGVFDPSRGNVEQSSVNISNPADLGMLQYHVHNTLGFLGKYQFGEPLLIDLGYYSPAPTGFYGTTATNEWKGTFTGKNGVFSKADFMTNAQELAIREAFAMNMTVIEQRLAQAGKTIDDFLGKSFAYTQAGIEKIAIVSISGILASAHLQGPGGVANLLLNGIVSHDEYGTNILSYMDKFGDFSSPFGTAGNDVLSGSEYSETFSGEGGHNTYQTGDGLDKIIIANKAGTLDVVTDFNIHKDVISLQEFSNLTFANLAVTQGSDGAHITLPNGQSIILQNVDASSLDSSHFIRGNYTLSWNANSGDTIVSNFNLSHDVIDLNYAFGVNNLAIYEQNGNTYIDVIGNNQRLVLQGVDLDALKPFNFIKAPVNFAEHFFDITSSPPPSTPPTEPPTTDPTPNPTPTPTPTPDGGHVYSYTWSWGNEAKISNFDLAHDKIDLGSFWTNYSAFSIHDNDQGDAVIDLKLLNNQTIVIENVSAAELKATHFMGVSGTFISTSSNPPSDPPPVVDPPQDPPTQPPENQPPADQQTYSYTWSWGSREVVNDFDPNHDVINLKSFWTDYQSIDIHANAQGNAVIDLTGLNNQTITLMGVKPADLSANNFSGINGNFNDALDLSTPSPNPTPNPTENPPPVSSGSTNVLQGNGGVLQGTADADAFTYTWSWGSRDQIKNFDVNKDQVDLHSFWTTKQAISIHDDAQHNAVIDLTDLNNQTITLVGVSASNLHDGNIIV